MQEKSRHQCVIIGVFFVIISGQSGDNPNAVAATIIPSRIESILFCWEVFQMKKKIVLRNSMAFLLSAVMAFSLCPSAAFAATGGVLRITAARPRWLI
ncbi:hypothetical protein [Xiamenia xianingshaonis]|uniref:Uncharacterized protein n=1 Tax=Xiamenia xianingshaonis TaxID=2682776 RepID=A0ABX0IGZ5_9ACTN|nr:hypothetical protein [Xiamenia xianingshaonis]NHM13488.1 hypothetical protein [Xiamenia xianingshaonis]